MRWLVLIVAPAAAWLLYHRYKDRRRPEPLAVTLATFVGGFVAGVACLAAFEALNAIGWEAGPEDGAARFLAYCVLAVGGLEETAKLIPFLVVAARSRHFDEEIDGIVYASVAALGFASYENLRYMEFLDGAAMVARAIASPLTHAVFASIWGHAAGRARHRGRSMLAPVAAALAISAIAHGVYDAVAVGAPAAFRPITAAIVLAIWTWRLRVLDRLGREPGGAASP